MKLKYYLRGLGIGIVVTAVIMSMTAGGRKETLSDMEIKERAKALGMTEQGSVLSDLKMEEGEEAEPEAADEAALGSASAEETEQTGRKDNGELPDAAAIDPTEEPKPTATAKPTATPFSTEAPKPTETPKPTEAPTSKPMATPGSAAAGDSEADEEADEAETGNTMSGEGMISIEVKSGESSFTICQKLEDAGLVASAFAFDSYLYQNGYDKKLKAGIHEIPVSAQPEEIAKLLSS